MGMVCLTMEIAPQNTFITASVINIPGVDPTVPQEVRRIQQRRGSRSISLKTSQFFPYHSWCFRSFQLRIYSFT